MTSQNQRPEGLKSNRENGRVELRNREHSQEGREYRQNRMTELSWGGSGRFVTKGDQKFLHFHPHGHKL